MKGHISFKLGMVFIKEGDTYVSYIPALDLSTHGDSVEDAAKAGSEASKLFLEELIKDNTFEEVLLNLGWQKVDQDFSLAPPEVLYGEKPVEIQCQG